MNERKKIHNIFDKILRVVMYTIRFYYADTLLKHTLEVNGDFIFNFIQRYKHTLNKCIIVLFLTLIVTTTSVFLKVIIYEEICNLKGYKSLFHFLTTLFTLDVNLYSHSP